jgi:signal transduction histidine kinase
MELDPELERQEKSDSDHIPEKVRLSIYRIAEEALTNALKQGGANNRRGSIGTNFGPVSANRTI